MRNKALSEIAKQAAAILGLKPEVIGKTQARQEFLPLVASLNNAASAIEITDHDQPVAVLLSYNHWVALLSKLAMLSKVDRMVSPPDLIGSIQVTGDLEAGSKKAAQKLRRAAIKSAESL